MVLVTALESVYARVEADKKIIELQIKQKEVEDYLKKTGELIGIKLDEKFIYGTGNVKTNNSFFIDSTLKTNLDNFLIPAVAARWDGLFMVTGMEGCQPAGSKVLMANGEWKNIEDIKEGDLVLSPQHDGKYIYSSVIETYKFFSKDNYIVKEKNRKHKELYKCSYNHRIPINISKYTDGKKEYSIKEFEAQDYYNRKKSMINNETTLTSLPISQFLGRENCKIEPYSLGVYLGDGSFSSYRSNKTDGKYKGFWLSRQLNITSANPEIIEEISKYYPHVKEYSREGNLAKVYRYSLNTDFCRLLTAYGLEGKGSGDKFIPKEAMLSDIDYRKKLLSGLIDSDGNLSRGCSYSICTKSEIMANDIKNLVYSLGGRASVRKIHKSIKSINFTGTYFNVSFYLGEYNLFCKVKHKIKNNKSFYRSPNRTTIELEKINGSLVYGFLLDSPSHLYITDNYAVTLNSGKTTFSGAISRYLDPTWPGELIDDKSARRHCDRIVFSPQQFFDIVDSSEPKQAILFDEAILGLMGGDSGTHIQKMLMKKLTLIRKKQLYIIMVIPSIFSMRMQIAVNRSRFLIHTYTPDGIRRGYMKFYNYPTKRLLYMKGKRDVNQDAVEADFRGTFVDTESLFYSTHEYDVKKEAAINNLTLSSKGKSQGLKEYKTEGQRNLLLSYIFSLLEGQPIGKQQLEYIVKLHNEFAQAVKPHDRLNPSKFKDFLDKTFGEHMEIGDATLREYLKKAAEYVSKPVKPLEEPFKPGIPEGIPDSQ